MPTSPAALRRPIAPALRQLIMSSAPMRNDGTYDMTEQERLAQGALCRSIVAGHAEQYESERQEALLTP